MKRTLIIFVVFVALIVGLFYVSKNFNINPAHSVGEAIDSLNNVKVYYNGAVGNIEDRNVVEGYNLGMKYQCVEFVKRYYFEHYDHRMPDTYGNAKDFFDPQLEDGKLNLLRALNQYTNPSKSHPLVGDLIVMSASLFNEFGHVAIVSKVEINQIEIIQQNPGPFSKSREVFILENKGDKWFIKNERIMGWLRK